ncbi:hypothetical protein MPTK1_7g14780 [Marchantia polymorpha subsp. ruderalis]|uniref:Uncharacterized protein n=2 Tax=Marchantia polymorpha TaxID=3197 RepID=A0AAF6BZN5_MARPO|nr:hypothetical protein MARPO_0009s0163 [Marchantia polymorpha]BBN17469.1 hypothetical protein Mp_7g14780 [Marchantia polymorpha subsp. ruderalis]|eukprot:PTQ47076.1 hypothetical protein MARPO_0009s0163 [Marchantia polymorpha]
MSEPVIRSCRLHVPPSSRDGGQRPSRQRARRGKKRARRTDAAVAELAAICGPGGGGGAGSGLSAGSWSSKTPEIRHSGGLAGWSAVCQMTEPSEAFMMKLPVSSSCSKRTPMPLVLVCQATAPEPVRNCMSPSPVATSLQLSTSTDTLHGARHRSILRFDLSTTATQQKCVSSTSASCSENWYLPLGDCSTGFDQLPENPVSP